MKRSILVIICFIGGLFLVQEVFALTISPVKWEGGAYPGQEVRTEMLLINEENETKVFYSSFANFKAKEETGKPEFIEEETGLATWFEVASQVTLGPDEKKRIPFSIRIPQDAEPGGYFAAIFWGTSPPIEEKGPQLSLGAKLGMLVLLRVEGEVKEEGKLLEFTTENKKSFFSHLPISLIYRFENNGNVQLTPSGEIEIKNIFGGTSTVLLANEDEGSVLPKSIRKFVVEWNPKEAETTEKGGFFEELKREKNNFVFGRYTATLNLEYGREKEEIQANFSFFVIPWRILTLAILIVVVIVLVLTKGIKKYNQWIIAKAKMR